MNVKYYIILSICLLTLTNTAHAQKTDQEIAWEKGAKAIEMMENGLIPESIELLQEAMKLDPGNINYPYEMALANYFRQDYQEAVKILKKLIKHKDVNPKVYQALGNSYSSGGDRKKAIKTYESGIKKFPDAGPLYLERGNVEMFVNEFNNAMYYYEKGIEVDPTYPSNYYRASRLFSASTEKVWTMIYGEIFMNLERNTQRTAEISKLLYDVYKEGITINDTTLAVSFSKENTIFVDRKKMSSIKFPFGMAAYEMTLAKAIIGKKEININSLDSIRTRFVELYYEDKRDELFPNALFDYQKKVMEAGHLSAYNHWILMKGDEDAFGDWYAENSEKWNKFIEWFSQNPIQLNKDHKVYRKQY